MRNWLQMLIYLILFTCASFVGVICCIVGVYVSYGLLIPGYALVADGEIRH